MARFTSAVAAALLASASLASAQVSTAFGGSGAFVPQRGALIKTDAAGDEIYFADNVAHVVRKFTVNTNTLTTVAGAAFTSGVVDGAATAARFNAPQGLCTDGTSLFVADSGNHRIRKIVIATGVVSTFAGSTSGDTDAQSDPLKAKFNTPIDCAILTRTIDSVATSEFYITEQNRIRRINGTNYVSTVAGDASAGLADGATPLFSGPTGICSDNGSNLYVADTGNNRIRKVAVTVAAGTNAATVVASTWGAAPATIGPVISFADGNTLSAVFSAPTDCVYGNAADEIYVADRGNSRIRKVAGGAVTTIAGSAAGDADGTAAGTVRLWAPISVHAEGTATTTTKPSKLYVLDERARNIRQLTLATAGGVLSASKKLAGANAAATFPTFTNCVERAAFDVYCTDSTQHVVRRIKDGVVTTAAGTVGTSGSGDSETAGTSATFNGPTYLAVAGVNLYISDSGNGKIRRFDVTANTNAGKVETLADTSATPATCTSTQGVAVKSDGTALWFACNANKIYRIGTPTGAVTGITWTGVLGTHATAADLVAIPANPISNTAGTDATKANTATSVIHGLCLGRLAAAEDSLFVLESNRILGISTAANGWGGASAGLYGPFTGTVAAGSTTTSATTGALLNGPRACLFGDNTAAASATNLLYVLEGAGNRVRGFDLTKNTVSDRIPAVQIGGGAATGTTAGDGIGVMTAATTGAVVSFRAPTDLFLQAEALASTVTLGVVDGGNGRIKSVSLPTTGFLGTASHGLYRKVVVPTLCCALSTSVSVCLSGDHKFYKYTRSGSAATLSFFAGQGGTTGVDGDAVTGTVKTAATAVACDATNSNVYFFDSLGTDKIRKIASTGAISTITTNAAISGTVTDVHGLAVIPTGSAAGIYVSTKITPANGAIHIKKSALDGTGVADFWKESGTTAAATADTNTGAAANAGATNSPAKKVTRLCVGKQAADGDTLFAVANDNDVAAGATTVYAIGTAAAAATGTVVDKDKVTIFYGGATSTADDSIETVAGKSGKLTGGGPCAQIGTDLYVRELKRVVKIPVAAAASRTKTAQWGKYTPTVAVDASCSTAVTLAATTDVFNTASDLWSDGTTLSVLDGSKRIHQITTSGSCTADTVTVQSFDAVVDAAAPANPTALTAVGGFANGALGFGSLFNSPSGIAQAGSDFYVTDTNNHVIRKVAIANGTATVSVWAGEVGTAGDVIEGDGSLQRFNAPTFIVSNFSNAKWWLYVSDAGNNKVKKIEAAAQPVTTILAGAAAGTTASGNTPSAAGTNTPAAEALFNAPAGLAIAGDWVFVADSGNNAIKKISAAGVVTFAFSGTLSSPAVATDAFLNPQGLLANGTSWLLVADKGRHRIRRCDIANATAAVTACTNYIGTGVAGVTDSTLSSPHGIEVDQKGNFYVIETGSSKVRRFSHSGVTLSVAIGASAAGAAGLVEQAAADASGAGTYTTARISGATDLVFDSANPTVAYIADAGNHRIRKVDVLGERATTATVTATTTNTTTMTNTTTTTRTATATTTTTSTQTSASVTVEVTWEGAQWAQLLATTEGTKKVKDATKADVKAAAEKANVTFTDGTSRRQVAVKLEKLDLTPSPKDCKASMTFSGSAADVTATTASVTASEWTNTKTAYGGSDFKVGAVGTVAPTSANSTTTVTTTKAPTTSSAAVATMVAVIVAVLAVVG